MADQENINVLYVDDEPVCRSTFGRVVRTAGYNVQLAANGTDALKLARQHDFSVVVTDLKMPGLDGIELIRALGAESPNTSFVLVTGARERGVESNTLLDQGLTSIVLKPWETEDMIEALERAIRLSGRNRSESIAPFKLDSSNLPILLVEDNLADAKLFQRHLRKLVGAAARVDHAVRLEDALELVRSQAYLAVVTDLSLPDARGLDTVARLRAAAPKLPIVVLSGVNDEKLSLQVLHLGAQDYLEKGQVTANALNRVICSAVQRKRAEEELMRQAHQDSLTGLYNRGGFLGRAQHALARCERRQEAFGLLFIDLDHFKPINDTYGHEAGDLLLQVVANRLKAATRNPDTVARLGGDEFAILVEAPADRGIMALLTERISQAICYPTAIHGHDIRVTCSIGGALFPDDGKSVKQLLRFADSTMYAVKRIRNDEAQ